MKLTHIRLLVPNFVECFAFYRDVMGLKVIMGDEASTYAEFDTGHSHIALFNRQSMASAIGTTDQPEESPCQDPIVLTFDVDNVDEAFTSLKEKGAQVTTEPTDRSEWSIRTAHFRDPANNLIEINEAIAHP